MCRRKATEVQKELKLEPGNVGFDPLGLFPKDAATQEKYKLAELKHGPQRGSSGASFAGRSLLTAALAAVAVG